MRGENQRVIPTRIQRFIKCGDGRYTRAPGILRLRQPAVRMTERIITDCQDAVEDPEGNCCARGAGSACLRRPLDEHNRTGVCCERGWGPPGVIPNEAGWSPGWAG